MQPKLPGLPEFNILSIDIGWVLEKSKEFLSYGQHIMQYIGSIILRVLDIATRIIEVFRNI